MMQDAEPIGLEEEISVSKDTVISDERPSRPTDCIRSPRSTSVFGFNYPNAPEPSTIQPPMKLALTVLAMAALAAGAYANDTSSGTYLVPNGHGGFNVAQGGEQSGSIAFFGSHGFAANVIAHSQDKPKFIIVPAVQDDGHGNKHTIYHKVFFATAEEAEAAKGGPH